MCFDCRSRAIRWQFTNKIFVCVQLQIRIVRDLKFENEGTKRGEGPTAGAVPTQSARAAPTDRNVAPPRSLPNTDNSFAMPVFKALRRKTHKLFIRFVALPRQL